MNSQYQDHTIMTNIELAKGKIPSWAKFALRYYGDVTYHRTMSGVENAQKRLSWYEQQDANIIPIEREKEKS